MIEDLLQDKIREYNPANALEQENVLQELMQHFVLASLARAGFFLDAEFHGGTCLRILYNLHRFSEDLDFLLKKPNQEFVWTPYLNRIKKDCELEGIHFEVLDKSTADTAVKKAFLKTDSIGNVLMLKFPHSRYTAKRIRIKLEIDTNPPSGSIYETRYIAFPVSVPITTQTLESGFALKSHALLCRDYTKGRDWYDLLWYISREIVPNYKLLENALEQQGPWTGKKSHVNSQWYLASLRRRVKNVDWSAARKDIRRFVTNREQESIELWDKIFFLYHVDRLEEYLA